MASEVSLPGGLYWTDSDGTSDDERTELSVEEGGEDEHGDSCFVLHVTSGNVTFSMPGIARKDLVRIGKFLIEQAGGG